jgi:hypothetical protein
MNIIKLKEKVLSDSDAILSNARGNLRDVIIIGVSLSGELYFESNITDKRDLLYQIEQLKFDLMAGVFDADD